MLGPLVARPMAGALIRRQARVNPLRSLARLAAQLPAVATGTAAISVAVKGSRLVSVATTAGQIAPGAVVLADAARHGWVPAGVTESRGWDVLVMHEPWALLGMAVVLVLMRWRDAVMR